MLYFILYICILSFLVLTIFLCFSFSSYPYNKIVYCFSIVVVGLHCLSSCIQNSLQARRHYDSFTLISQIAGDTCQTIWRSTTFCSDLPGWMFVIPQFTEQPSGEWNANLPYVHIPPCSTDDTYLVSSFP